AKVPPPGMYDSVADSTDYYALVASVAPWFVFLAMAIPMDTSIEGLTVVDLIGTRAFHSDLWPHHLSAHIQRTECVPKLLRTLKSIPGLVADLGVELTNIVRVLRTKRKRFPFEDAVAFKDAFPEFF